MADQNTTKKQIVPFTQIVNDVLDDTRISLKAKGLYAFMFSKPDGWAFHTKGLKSQLKEGDEAIVTGLSELVEAGWITRTKKRSTGKFAGYEYYFNTTLPKQKSLSHRLVVSRDGKSDNGLPVAENPEHSNTIKSNIEREDFFSFNENAITQYIDELLLNSSGIRNEVAYKRSLVNKFMKGDPATIVEFNKWVPQYKCNQLCAKYKNKIFSITTSAQLSFEGKFHKILVAKEGFVLEIENISTHKISKILFKTFSEIEPILIKSYKEAS